MKRSLWYWNRAKEVKKYKESWNYKSIYDRLKGTPEKIEGDWSM
jgi:hypothetical protein